MNISEAQTVDELFHIWKDLRQDYVEFSNDGILLEHVWEKQNPKIAFLLKEPNDDFFANIRGQGHSPAGNSTVFWRNINMWSFTVKQFFNGATITFEEALARKEDTVDHIAYINLKKKHQGRSVSDPADIQGYVDRDWEFLEQQLRLVNPDVLFCGGTYQYIRPHITATELGDGVHRWNNLTLINFFHPSYYFKGYEETFEILSRMLRNLPSPIPNAPNA